MKGYPRFRMRPTRRSEQGIRSRGLTRGTTYFAAHRARRGDRTGFALLATLWLSMAITTVVLAFALEARRDRMAVANLAESEQALAAAQAGVATVMSRLDRLTAGTAPTTSMPYDPTDPWQWADTILRDRVDLNGLRYEVEVQDVGALLDINQASEDDWRSFLTALNIDYGTADHLAQTISDWRDPDDDARSNGAERQEYIHSGRLVVPTNRDFRSIEELKNVIGMTPAIFHTIQPYLGVGTSNGRVSINTAPVPVLKTLPGMTDDIVTVILAERSGGTRIQSVRQLGQVSPLLTARASFTTQEVIIRCRGWAPGGRTSATLVADVRAGSTSNPTSTIGWRRVE